jgi:hypothetical protein
MSLTSSKESACYLIADGLILINSHYWSGDKWNQLNTMIKARKTHMIDYCSNCSVHTDIGGSSKFPEGMKVCWKCHVDASRSDLPNMKKECPECFNVIELAESELFNDKKVCLDCHIVKSKELIMKQLSNARSLDRQAGSQT